MRRMRRWRRQIYRRVIQLEVSPHRVGLGAAFGVFFGTLMPPGLQLVTSLPLAFLCRASAIAAAAGTCVSNPITYVPLYYSTCRVGERVLQLLGSPICLGQGLRSLLEQAAQLDFRGMLAALEPLLASWAMGGLIIGLALAVPAYALAYLIVVQAHRVREFARARRAARHRELAAKRPPQMHIKKQETTNQE